MLVTCWETAEREVNQWISKDKMYTKQKSVGGNLGSLKELNDEQKLVKIACI